MKTTIIPAQITTVEDKIAGNLSLTQILILMFPVFWTVFVYVIPSPRMAFAWYKVFITVPVLIISFILSLRIQEKLVINWLILVLRYNLKPKYYVFNKNDVHLRVLDIPIFEKKNIKVVSFAKLKKKVSTNHYGISEQMAFEKDENNLAFKINKKGGFNVVFDQIEK
jgi:hypothetical protein